MQSAAAELLSFGVCGLQLTPGLVPTEKFHSWLEERQVKVRTHHGFHWQRMRAKVWSETADCLVVSDSVHPPLKDDLCAGIWQHRAECGDYNHLILETMYPGYCLGNGEELLWAMDLGLKLAVDVSHIYLQLCQSSLEPKIWRKLQNYELIQELHLSANSGKADSHQPITKKTFGLDWIRERSSDGTFVILESYIHRLSLEERQQQLMLVQDFLQK
ncbi:hypothetical protein H6G76_34790 [Nostoc sp. FACHB-152]|uniref:hypothetical protein n=1 Tax=Nostoc sp. FACHB-152 TaxID=2692837 RepID=UPI0016875080|nr:hypothetical protein [Nostoc sp. FACHB-152]MBD2452183.1 hypothetical protein [Nostoc sp. FACHB-152]